MGSDPKPARVNALPMDLEPSADPLPSGQCNKWQDLGPGSEQQEISASVTSRREVNGLARATKGRKALSNMQLINKSPLICSIAVTPQRHHRPPLALQCSSAAIGRAPGPSPARSGTSAPPPAVPGKGLWAVLRRGGDSSPESGVKGDQRAVSNTPTSPLHFTFRGK